MKKKIIIISIILILIIVLIPIRTVYKDGGTKKYKSLTYEITKVHTLNEVSPTGFDEGIIIKIFGQTIYNNVIFYIEENNLKSEDVVNEEGLIFRLSRNDKDCTPMLLDVYEDGSYRLFTTYESCLPWETCAMMLQYADAKTGNYEYDVLKIINHSKKEETPSTTYKAKYEILLGKENQRYVTGSNNEYLKEFLESIDVNIDNCANAKYQ